MADTATDGAEAVADPALGRCEGSMDVGARAGGGGVDTTDDGAAMAVALNADDEGVTTGAESGGCGRAKRSKMMTPPNAAMATNPMEATRKGPKPAGGEGGVATEAKGPREEAGRCTEYMEGWEEAGGREP